MLTISVLSVTDGTFDISPDCSSSVGDGTLIDFGSFLNSKAWLSASYYTNGLWVCPLNCFKIIWYRNCNDFHLQLGHPLGIWYIEYLPPCAPALWVNFSCFSIFPFFDQCHAVKKAFVIRFLSRNSCLFVCGQFVDGIGRGVALRFLQFLYS